MRQPQIMGIPYKPVLEPEYRIVNFLNGINELLSSDNLTEGGITGITAAKTLAEIWFNDEVQVLKLRQQ